MNPEAAAFTAGLKTASSIGGAAIDTFNRANMTSLVDFIKPSLIESPCFLQDSLAEEPIINDVIKNLYNIYIGYILIALQMNESVSGSRNVRDMLSVVASTEGFIDHQMLVEGLGGVVPAVEADRDDDWKRANQVADRKEDRGHKVGDRSQDRAYQVGDRQEDRGHKVHDRSEDRAHQVADRKQDRDFKVSDSKTRTGSISAQHFSEKHQASIASGRQIEVSFATLDGREQKIMLNVKFNTRLIPEQVVEYILAQDFTMNVYNRYLQMRSGEIRFFKDFIFGVDKVHRQAKAIKHDKGHALQDLLKHKHGSTVKHMSNFVQAYAGKAPKSYNIANSILILDEASVNRYTKRTGFDFSHPIDRNRFFANTYNLFIVLIDTRYSRVTIYTNGIDQAASYSFSEMKSSATSDKMSLKEVMEYMSKAQMPKF